jgi:hypothetical protein
MSAIGPGIKQTVTERGWFAPPFTACRFAVIAQIALRMGYQVPLTRQPKNADNFVRDLQLAGDNTPHNGSTMRQGQKAVRALLPGAPFLFGTMSDAEMFAAVQKGATVGFAVDCSKLPRYLKNFVGYGYKGDHYMAIDGTDGVNVDLSDPMYRPAGQAKPRSVPFGDIEDAVLRDKAGDMIVTLGYQDAAYLGQELAEAQTALIQAQAAVIAAQAKVDQITAAQEAIA